MGKTLALGTILSVEDDTPAFIPVGNLTTVPVPSGEKGEVEMTDFDSVAKEYLPTLTDNGVIEFGGFFNGTNPGQLLLLDDANDPDATARNFQIDFVRQDIRFTFMAFVRRAAPTAPGPEQPYSFAGSIRVTGAVARVTPIPA